MTSIRRSSRWLRFAACAPIILFLGASAAAQACDEPLSVASLRQDAAPFTEQSGFDDATQIVIRDAAAWADAWRVLHRGTRIAPALPEVDFEREMIVAVALGLRRSGGYAVRIQRAWREGNRTIIAVRTVEPAPGCITTTAITRPADVARMGTQPEPVEFRFESQVRRCD